MCGVMKRPLDPQQPGGTQIDLHYAVLPALARNKHPDPVFFFAGGPGQSAMQLAGPLSRQMARLSNRRDLVLIDQRGTGRSAPLTCNEPAPNAALQEALEPGRAEAQLQACLASLRKLPHGDLRHYTTWVAMQDADAVREALGAEQINAVGVSYGTRAALDYQRQFPARVRRLVLDGVAPADMRLPQAFAQDNEAALQALLKSCDDAADCKSSYPQLRGALQQLMLRLPQRVMLRHPVTGATETVTLTADAMRAMLLGPLYVPALASTLPLAITQAAQGNYDALLGAGLPLQPNRRGQGMASGMHYSVICSEDVPIDGATATGATGAAGTVAAAAATAKRAASTADAPIFGSFFADRYQRICADWPRGNVPPAFYTLPRASGAALVTSGGIDPVTPPRHGERVMAALGPQARHVVVPNAGHGVLNLGCMRDVLFRFIDAADGAAALKVDTRCAEGIPRPPVFVLPSPAAAAPVLQATRP
jgi:pimeloyl-ACP methyl ester carboxylesterase